MHTKKGRFVFMLGMAAMSLGLAACGGGGGDEGSTDIYEKPHFEGELEYDDDGNILFDNVTVEMLSVIGDPDLAVHKELINKFNDEYAGQIYIHLSSQAHNDYYPALENLWKNNKESFPDLCFMHNEKTSVYANKGYLYPLEDETLQELGCKLDFNQTYSNIDRVTKFNNVRFAVPVDCHGFLTYFRTDIILKNGCGFDNNTRAIPKSRAEYQSLLKNLKEKAAAGQLLIRDIAAGHDHAWKTAPTSWAPSCYQGTDPDGLSALYANGGSMTKDDGKKIAFHENEGFKRYIFDQVENQTKGYFTNGDGVELFPQGNTVMFNEGPWQGAMSYEVTFNNSDLTSVNEALHVTQDDVDNYSKPFSAQHPDGWWTLEANESLPTAHKWYGNGHIMALTTTVKDINVAAAAVEFMNWYINGKSTFKINGTNKDAYNLARWCSSGHASAWKHAYESEEYDYYRAKSVTLRALGDPNDVIAMESHPYETTVFNAVASAVGDVQTKMRSSAGCTIAEAQSIIDEVVTSAQSSLDMYFEAEEEE